MNGSTKMQTALIAPGAPPGWARTLPQVTTRVDKWLWAARFFKTRELASKACEMGRITSNGVRAKPTTASCSDRFCGAASATACSAASRGRSEPISASARPSRRAGGSTRCGAGSATASEVGLRPSAPTVEPTASVHDRSLSASYCRCRLLRVGRCCARG